MKDNNLYNYINLFLIFGVIPFLFVTIIHILLGYSIGQSIGFVLIIWTIYIMLKLTVWLITSEGCKEVE